MTEPRSAFSSESFADLLRTPFRPETVGDDLLEGVDQMDVLSTFLLAFDGESVGLFVAVVTLAGVAPELSTHGEGMHSEKLGGAAHGVIFFPQDAKAFIAEEMSVDHVYASVFYAKPISASVCKINVS